MGIELVSLLVPDHDQPTRPYVQLLRNGVFNLNLTYAVKTIVRIYKNK